MKLKVARKGDWFRKLAHAQHGRVQWRPVLDFPIDVLAREARSADLVIIGRAKTPGDAYSSLDPGVALLRIGRMESAEIPESFRTEAGPLQSS